MYSSIAIVSSQLNDFSYCCLTLIFLFNITHFAELSGYKYCYVSLTIQLDISHLFTQRNDQIVLSLTIQLRISPLLAQFKYQRVLFDP